MNDQTRILIAALFFSFTTIASPLLAQDWVRQSPFPADNHLNDVHFVSALAGWIVGEDGIVMRTLDGGSNWEQHSDFPRQPQFEDDALKAIQFVDAQNGFIGGDNVFRTVDGGQSWQDMGFHSGVSRMQFVSPSTGFITTNGGLRRTVDGGQTFSTVFGICSDLSFLDENLGIVSSGGDIHRTVNGGNTWSMISTQGMTRLLLVNETIAIGTGLNGLFRSSDGGATWTQVLTSANNFSGLHLIDGDSIAAVDNAFGIFVSDDLGATWTQTGPAIGNWSSSASIHYSPDGTTGYVAGSAGLILKSVDEMQPWQQISQGAAVTLFDIQMTVSGFGIAVGEGLTVLRTTDFGRHWTAQTIEEPSSSDLQAVQVIDDDTVVATGDNSAFYRSDDGGVTWTSLTNGIRSEVDLNDLWFENENVGWLFGSTDTLQLLRIYHTTNGGATWSRVDTSVGLFGAIEGQMSDSDSGWALDITNRLFITDDNWATIDVRSIPAANESYEHFEFADAEVGWFSGRFGTVAKTTDGGLTFMLQTLPGFGNDDRATDVVALSPDQAYIATYNLAGVERGTIYETLNGGTTWTPLNEFFDPTNALSGRIIEIDVLPSGGIWAASVGAGFIWASDVPEDILPGDVNQDGEVTLLDVAPFVKLITTGTFQAEADVNGDGVVDLLDVAPFVELLTGK